MNIKEKLSTVTTLNKKYKITINTIRKLHLVEYFSKIND